MSGDLEDFLKRAAQRRRERAQQQHEQQSKPRQRPEYTDRRAERKSYSRYDDEIDEGPLMAEVIDVEDVVENLPHVQPSPPNPPAKQQRKRKQPATPPIDRPREPAATLPEEGIDAEQLMAWMRTPAGLKQAILIREILDRPTHRWD